MMTERIGGWAYRREQVLHLLLTAGLVLALLDSKGLVDRANQMSVGPLREGCLAAAVGLQTVAHALLVDRPVLALHGAFIAATQPEEAPAPEPPPPVARAAQARPAGTTAPVAAAGATAPAKAAARPQPVYSAQRPLRVLLIGDSMMEDLQVHLRPAMQRDPAMRAKVDYKVSTGLSRPDFFDWPGHMREVLARERHDMIVLVLGPNDFQDIKANGRRYHAGNDDWCELYAQRAAKFAAQLAAQVRRLYWVGLPPMRSADYQAHMRLLDESFRKACAALPNAVYLPTTAVLGGPSGEFTSYLTVDGKRTLVRRGDGCHCTMAGAKLVAEMVYKRVRADAFPPAAAGRPAG